MHQLKAGRTAACSAALILALGAGVFALRDAPDNGSVDGIPVAAGTVPPPEDAVSLMEPDRPAPVVELVPEASVEDVIGARTVLSDSDDGRWNEATGGVVSDTGPFIDADDDAGDYTFAPVSEVGEFLDPDEG